MDFHFYVETGNKCDYNNKYVAKTANNLANAKPINSRRGLDIDNEEFKLLDEIIKKGIDEDKSIYQIKIENKNVINKSITTLYRYVNNGYLTTKRCKKQK